MQRQENNFMMKHQENKLKLTKWERYRETKIEMVASFIKILKRQTHVKRLISLMTLRKALVMNNH